MIVRARGDFFLQSLVQLDSKGNPVISYYEGVNGDLKLAVSNDRKCTSKEIITVDSVDVGDISSLQLAGAVQSSRITMKAMVISSWPSVVRL